MEMTCNQSDKYLLNLSKELFNLWRDFINKITGLLSDYKEEKSELGELYTKLWSTCGQSMFKIGVLASQDFLDESEEFFLNLCRFIIKEDGIKSKNNFLGNSNPLSLVLQNLSDVYYRREKYKDAMTVTALNGLISYNDEDTKAFESWAKIKETCQSSEEILNQTMLGCLKNSTAVYNELGVEIQFEDYNLTKFFKREIECLQNAKVDLSSAIKVSFMELEKVQNNMKNYVKAVLRFCNNVNFFREDNSIDEYLNISERHLSTFYQDSVHSSCLMVNVQFFKFMQQCKANIKKISVYMKNATITMKKYKNEISDKIVEPEEAVPICRTINLERDRQAALELEKVLLNWEKIFSKDPSVILNCWEPQITLDFIITAGEIARLYLWKGNEKRAWFLSYKLASVLNNHAICLYVIARGISLRYIDKSWTLKAREYADSLKKSENVNDKSTVIIFWLSLADFCFENGKIESAFTLLNAVDDLESSFRSKPPVRFGNAYTIIKNLQFIPETHHSIIDQYVDMMITIIGTLEINGKETFYGLNTVLDGMNNISLVMNSLISFKEISAQLTFGLELAQSFGADLRVAECLKSLFILICRIASSEINDSKHE